MKPNRRQLFVFVISLVLTCAITFALTYWLVPRQQVEVPGPPIVVNPPKTEGVPEEFEELIAYLKEYSYYGLPDGIDLSAYLASAIVAATGDPYAAYFTDEEYTTYAADLSGNFVGIGGYVDSIDLSDDSPVIRLIAVFTGSPAASAGLLPGDLITAVDGISIAELGGYSAALSAIAGEADTPVILTILRGETAFDVTVIRGECTKETVYSGTVPGTTLGYVRITAFDTVTTGQFIRAVSALEESGVTGLIFDLRYNGGGYLRTVSEMLAYLLPDGDLCYVDYTSGNLADYTVYAKHDTLYFGAYAYTTDSLGEDIQVSHALNVPVAVLVNQSTASASELFTGALRDYGAEGLLPKVEIIGENTYGKGCVQTTFRLSNGDYVKATTALYAPPCGENYHGVGIAPTRAVVAADSRLSDLYLKNFPASLILFGGQTDTVLEAAVNCLITP